MSDAEQLGAVEHIARLRGQIDTVDDQLLGLLAQRLEIARALAQAKGGTPGVPDFDREAAVIARLLSQGLVPEPAVCAVWSSLFVVAREAQASVLVGKTAG